MQRLIYFILIIVLSGVLFTACPPTQINTPNPVSEFTGKWKSQSLSPYDDWFDVSSDLVTFTYYNNGDPTNDIAYQGRVFSFDVSGDITFLNLKITDNGSWDLTEDWFARIYIKKKSASICEMSTAWLNGSVKETLSQVKQSFTLENKAFGYIPEYTRQ